MTNDDAYELLTAVIADLEWVTDRLRENPHGPDATTLLAVATLSRDEFSRQVAWINAAIAGALLNVQR